MRKLSSVNKRGPNSRRAASLISVQLRSCFRGERLQRARRNIRELPTCFPRSSPPFTLYHTISKCMKHLLGHRRSRVVFINALLSVSLSRNEVFGISRWGSREGQRMIQLSDVCHHRWPERKRREGWREGWRARADPSLCCRGPI